MKSPIFLSASVPDRPPFSANFDPLAIREAVIALVAVTIRERPLVFGGHPAISPLVEHAARSLKALDNVHIYQSRFFEEEIPDAAKKFRNLHWTDRQNDRQTSLDTMRRKMMSDWNLSTAVYVAGMDGIFDEHRIFTELHPSKMEIVVGTTGAAAARLLTDLRERFNTQTFKRLSEERQYRKLFRDLLPN